MTLFTYFILSVAVLGLVGLLITLVAIRLAPEGYENETGFHYTQSPVGAENSLSPFPGVAEHSSEVSGARSYSQPNAA